MAVELQALSAQSVAAFRAVLGAEHVVTSAPVLDQVSTATFATTQRASVLLRPADRHQVRAVLKIAAEHRIPVWPVSRGRNWGYGSRVPMVDGAAVLDLSRLDRIVSFDPELGILTVEPGVTFAQAVAHLDAAGSDFFLATIGGPPDASVLANALDRGDGTGPHGDAFSHVGGMEVALTTGEMLRTGFGRIPGARAAGAARFGVGPALDGLFSQSNFGVVTELSLWLSRKTPALEELFGWTNDEAQLEPLIDAVRLLLQEGTLRGAVSLWNELKAFSKLGQYPYAQFPRTPLPRAAMEQLREGFFGGRWNLTGAIYARTQEIARLERARIEEVLRPLLGGLDFRAEAAGDSRLMGRTTGENLAMAYWRKRTPMPAEPDLDRDRCGLLWVSSAAPLKGRDLRAALEIGQQVPRLFALEPNLAVLATSPRQALVVSMLVYDREVGGEDERARACHDALTRELTQAGFPPARTGIQLPDVPLSPNDDSAQVLRRLKAALDPAGVLAPGRSGIR